MKVLFYIHSLGVGGAERVTSHLANYWAAKGWLVRVVTLEDRELDHYQLSSSVERVRLGLAENSSSAVVGLWNNLRRIHALRRELRNFEPDVAIGMMSTAAVILALARIGLRGIAVIGSERVHPPTLRLGAMWGCLRRYTYKLLDAVVVLAPASRDWVKNHTFAPMIEVIENPVSYPLPDTVSNPHCADDLPDRSRRLLLAIGRLDHQKGFDLLINAFASCAHGHADWDLVILGEGPKRKELEGFVASRALESRVTLPGRSSRVGDWLERADLYVLSSRFEGFPNTLLEAMAYGVPVVSFDCCTGPRLLIKHGENGLLVPDGDTAGLERAIDLMMSDSSLRERLGLEAQGVRNDFSMAAVADQWEKLFRDLERLARLP